MDTFIRLRTFLADLIRLIIKEWNWGASTLCEAVGFMPENITNPVKFSKTEEKRIKLK